MRGVFFRVMVCEWESAIGLASEVAGQGCAGGTAERRKIKELAKSSAMWEAEVAAQVKGLDHRGKSFMPWLADTFGITDEKGKRWSRQTRIHKRSFFLQINGLSWRASSGGACVRRRSPRVPKWCWRPARAWGLSGSHVAWAVRVTWPGVGVPAIRPPSRLGDRGPRSGIWRRWPERSRKRWRTTTGAEPLVNSSPSSSARSWPWPARRRRRAVGR